MTAGGRAPVQQDSAATQHTLNYALGNLGGRQKPWMISNPPDHSQAPPRQPPPLSVVPSNHYNELLEKRKRGRPPKARVEVLQQTAALGRASPTHDRSRDRHPPSNSTSPLLANTVAPHRLIRSPLPSPNAVLPSPSPSEDTVTESTAPATYVNNGYSAPTAAGTADFAEEPATNAAWDAMDQVRHAAKRLAGPEAGTADKRSRIGSSGHIEHAGLQGQIYSVAQQQYDEIRRRASLGAIQSRSPSLGQRQVPSPTSNVQSQVPSPRLQQGIVNPQPANYSATHTRIQNQVRFLPSRTPSSGPPNQPPSRPQSNPRPRAQPLDSGALPEATTWYSYQYCLQNLDRFEATRRVSPEHPRDPKRLEVLKDAVSKQDWAYLTMHQYYCMVDVDPASLPSSFRTQTNLPYARWLLREVLDTNDSLSDPVLHFFANFPMPLAESATRWPQRFEQESQRFLAFIDASANFNAVRAKCVARMFPPVAGELYYDIGISSPVFQRIVFTAVLRRIWARTSISAQHPQYEAHTVSVFAENQLWFYQNENRRSNNQPVTVEQRIWEMEHWGGRLGELCGGVSRLVGDPPAPRPVPLASTAAPQHQRLTRQSHHLSASRPPEQPVTSQVMPHFPGPQPTAAQVPARRGPGRPRLRPDLPHQPVPSQQPPQAVLPSILAPLLPQRGWHQPQQRLPNAARFGLHQADLRSPILKAQSFHAVLYQSVVGFAKPPVRLADAGRKIETWTFSVDTALPSIPRDIPGGPGEPASREVNENSKMLRLRSVKWPSTKLIDENAWATADTSWIPNAYFTFNGHHLHMRKKLHHGKDLPVDLSALVVAGENKLEIAILKEPDDQTYLSYLVAVEVVGFEIHERVKQRCLTDNRIPAFQSLDDIKRKLSSTNNDDEIAIVQSNLTIKLFDPFSASKICDIPTRGRSCLHYDCFDLETFLETRSRRDNTTLVDNWRCPICNADARPQHLVVDSFLQEVRAELAQKGLLNTRAIIMDQDGSWKPKVEDLDPNGVHEPGSPDEDERPVVPAARHFLAHPEVIDLSD